MINNNGKYYLVCNYDKYDNLSNYKIESISKVKIIDDEIKPLSKLKNSEDFNIASYINEHIYMFAGNTTQITIMLDNPKAINYVIEWYGNNARIKENDEGVFVTLNTNEQAFLYWALQYGQSIKIVKPQEIKAKYISMLKEIIDKYPKYEGDMHE